LGRYAQRKLAERKAEIRLNTRAWLAAIYAELPMLTLLKKSAPPPVLVVPVRFAMSFGPGVGSVGLKEAVTAAWAAPVNATATPKASNATVISEASPLPLKRRPNAVEDLLDNAHGENRGAEDKKVFM
jgi:hypothetical protein